MIVVGVDSAELTGVGVVARNGGGHEQLLLARAVRIVSASDVETTADQIVGFHPDVVAIEEPFYSPRFPGTGLVLARLLGRWLQAFETRGCTCVTVPASIWQSAMLTGLINGRSDRAARKSAAITWVRAMFHVDASEDEADAIALAIYTLRNASRRAATA